MNGLPKTRKLQWSRDPSRAQMRSENCDDINKQLKENEQNDRCMIVEME